VLEDGFIHCAAMIGTSLKWTVADYCSLRDAPGESYRIISSLIENTATLQTDLPARPAHSTLLGRFKYTESEYGYRYCTIHDSYCIIRHFRGLDTAAD